MTSRRQARRLTRAASATLAAPALRSIPRLHALTFFVLLLAPLVGVWAASRAIGSGAIVLVLALAAVSLAAFLAIPVGGFAQLLAAARARQMWEREPIGAGATWDILRPLMGRVVWRGMGPDGLFGGRDVAAWVYGPHAIAPQHRLFGRITALLVVLAALALGLPIAMLLVSVVGAAQDPAAALGASFLLGIGVSLALALYGGGALGILGAVAAAAEQHEALHDAPPPTFPHTTRRPARSGPTVAFRRA